MNDWMNEEPLPPITKGIECNECTCSRWATTEPCVASCKGCGGKFTPSEHGFRKRTAREGSPEFYSAYQAMNW